MALESTTVKTESYVIADQAGVFPYNFKMWAKEDFRVVVTDGDTERDLADGEFDVTGLGDKDGGIVLYSGSGDNLVVLSDRDTVQREQIENNTAMFPESVAEALDKNCRSVQQVEENLSRTIQKSPATGRVLEQVLLGVEPTDADAAVRLSDLNAKTIAANPDAEVIDTLMGLIGIDESGLVANQQYQVRGALSLGDGGDGFIYWDATADKADADFGMLMDPGQTIANQGSGVGTGGFRRVGSGVIYAEYYGIVADATYTYTSGPGTWAGTDNQVALERFVDAIAKTAQIQELFVYYAPHSGIDKLIPFGAGRGKFRNTAAFVGYSAMLDLPLGAFMDLNQGILAPLSGSAFVRISYDTVGTYHNTPFRGGIRNGAIFGDGSTGSKGLQLYRANNALIDSMLVVNCDYGYSLEDSQYNTFRDCVAWYNGEGFRLGNKLDGSSGGGLRANENKFYSCYAKENTINLNIENGSANHFNGCSLAHGYQRDLIIREPAVPIGTEVLQANTFDDLKIEHNDYSVPTTTGSHKNGNVIPTGTRQTCVLIDAGVDTTTFDNFSYTPNGQFIRVIDNSGRDTVLSEFNSTSETGFQNPDNMTETITGITAANPCVVTVTGTWNVGDKAYIDDVVGMTEINGDYYEVTAVGSGTITLDLNASGFTAYASGGEAGIADCAPIIARAGQLTLKTSFDYNSGIKDVTDWAIDGSGNPIYSSSKFRFMGVDGDDFTMTDLTLREGQLRVEDATWDNPVIFGGVARMWYESTTPALRAKAGVPTSETDGTVVA